MNWICTVFRIINPKFAIKDTSYITYKILYDTSNTIPRGARYHVYPVALGRKEEETKQNDIELYPKGKFTRKETTCTVVQYAQNKD